MRSSAPEPNDSLAPAVFLDRDGTIMRDIEYCGDPASVEIFPCAPAALQRLRGAGFKIFIITNQSGIARGYFTEEAYREVEREVARQIGEGVIDGAYFCPDLPESGCRCRKPAPGMILEAARDHSLDLRRSYMIGDKALDAQCGRNAGVRTILVETGNEALAHGHGADWTARDLAEAVEIVLRHAT